ncbi:hypothetical protein ABPG75_005768 [Micractinium tetrahymenae]
MTADDSFLPIDRGGKPSVAAAGLRHLASFALGALTALLLVFCFAGQWQELHYSLLPGAWPGASTHLMPQHREAGPARLPPPLPPLPSRQAAPGSGDAALLKPTDQPCPRRAEAAESGAGSSLLALPTLPWQPLLGQHEVARGLSYWGSGERLQRVAAKLLAGQPIKAYTLGGSVTMGRGASRRDLNYAARFFEFLNHTFPHRDHAFQNKGMGASSSGIFAACTERMVPPDADLVVLEFSLNDAEDAPFDSPWRAAYEQLARTLLALPSCPALLQLHHFRWWHPVPGSDALEPGLFYQPPVEDQLTVFAKYYDIPAASVRAAVHPLMRAGLERFKVNAMADEQDDGSADSFFYADKSHPGDGGHQVLAELLAAMVLRAAAAAAAGPEAATAQAGLGAWPAGSRLDGLSAPTAATAAERAAGGAAGGSAAVLPLPMVPSLAESETRLCSIQEDFQAAVNASQGFGYRPERPRADTFVGQKWAWTAVEPGSWAELLFDSRKGTAPGAAAVRGLCTHASVYIIYLRSYEHMGTALVTCVAGCRCAPTIIDGTWQTPASLQQMHKFYVTQHEDCRVRVAVRQEPGATPQEGHKVSLMGLIVSHFPVRLAPKEEGVETFLEEQAVVGSKEEGSQEEGSEVEEGSQEEGSSAGAGSARHGRGSGSDGRARKRQRQWRRRGGMDD